MARRFGKFNPRQPRDSHGRWTSKGGSSRSKSPAKTRAKKRPGNAENAQRAFGNAIGAAFSASTGRPIMAGLHTTAATAQLYHVASNLTAKRVAASTRLSASQKRNFTVRRKNIDRLVTKVEKAAEIGIAVGVLGGVASQGIAIARSGPIRGAGVRIGNSLGSGGAGLKAARSRRGVHKITTL